MNEKIVEIIVAFILAVAGSLLPVGVGFQIFTTPFYHPGWSESYGQFSPLFILLVIAGVLLACTKSGGKALIVSEFLAALGFAFLYREPSFQSDNWMLLIWMLHLATLSLSPGILFFVFLSVYPKIIAALKPA